MLITMAGLAFGPAFLCVSPGWKGSATAQELRLWTSLAPLRGQNPVIFKVHFIVLVNISAAAPAWLGKTVQLLDLTGSFQFAIVLWL